VLLDERLAEPILIGRPEVVQSRIERLGLRFRAGDDALLCNPDSDPRYDDYVAHYLGCMGRHGVTPEAAREIVRTRTTVIGAVMVARAEADALIAGPTGRFEGHLRHIREVLGLRAEARECSSVHLVILERGALFMADTYVSIDPPAEEIAEATLMATETVRRFGIEPKVALLSHSSFGSLETASAAKMRRALALVRERAPDLEVDGEMHADAALSAAIRARILPGSTLSGEANLLIFPDLDAANIAFNLVKAVTGAVSVGPILVGPARPAHVLTPSVTARGVVNLSAFAAVDALFARA
jgi:malate dehydrogenase (oxaloacetate-decarboxylating)(NADP+)